MRIPFLCLPKECLCLLRSSFSVVSVEIWQGCPGVKIYPKYVHINMYQNNFCFYRLSRALNFYFIFLLFTFPEESICSEDAMLQACRDAEQDCSYTSR